MSERIEFVRNCHDLSTDQGHQFEFFCDRCGGGFRTPFKPSMTGRVTSVLGAAGSLLGGVFDRAADLSERARSATWEQAHDKAYAAAVAELKGDFAQCPHCQSWVCRAKCWNQRRGLCKNCDPEVGVEMAAAQADKTREEIWAHARMAAEDKQLSEANWRETIVATCPQCEAELAENAKFCPECGHNLRAAAFCGECGEKLKPGAKFCAECGTKAGD
jgi:hypothetical protein